MQDERNIKYSQNFLRNGDLVEIDKKNQNQVDVFLKLRDEGLIEINEVEPKKYLAKWRL